MKYIKLKTILVLVMLSITVIAQSTVVRFETTVGDIDIEMFESEAPLTVSNFLGYVNRGDYDGTVIHRTDPGFIIQGGGYRFLGNKVFDSIPTVSPIVNEAAVSNTQGTISMARTSAPNSATSQWFFNLANNSVLDANSSNAGYAVFGQVIRGMDVLYVMESLLRINFFDSTPRGPFGEFPLYRYDEGTNPQQSNPVLDRNVVEIYRAYVLAETFNINAGLSGAWFNPDTVGQGIYFEVLPSVDTLIMAWFTHDTELPGDAVPSTIGAAGNRWITASGNYQGDQFIGKIYVTTGGLFNDPTAVTFIEVGEVIITFSSCGEAVMSFVLEDSEISDSINIQRISGANIALCEQLSIAADQGVSTQ